MREKLDLVFYRFYLFQFTINNAPAAEFSALLHVSCVILFHFFTIEGLLSVIWSIRLFETSLLLLLGMLFGTIMVNYFVFMFSQRHKRVLKEHRKESEELIIKRNKQIAIYSIVTFLAWCLSIFLMAARNNGMYTSN